jgi:hypothetical protein
MASFAGWQSDLDALIRAEECDAALSLVEKARAELSHSEFRRLVQQVEATWGRALRLADLDCSPLSRERSKALVDRATASRSLSLRDAENITLKELVVSMIVRSPPQPTVICRKALDWDLGPWAVCEFLRVLHEGLLLNLFYSADFAPPVASLRSALRAAGYHTLAHDLPLIYVAASEGKVPAADDASPAWSTAVRPSSEELVEQAITAVASRGGGQAVCRVLRDRYAVLAPVTRSWRALEIGPGARWMFRPAGRMHGPWDYRGVPMEPWRHPGHRLGEAPLELDTGTVPPSEVGGTACPDEVDVVLRVDDAPSLGLSGWMSVRWSTDPDRARAASALTRMPIRLLVVDAAARTIGRPVLGAMLRLGYLSDDALWEELAETTTSTSRASHVAVTVGRILSNRSAGMVEPAARVAAAWPAMVEVVLEAARVRVPDDEAEVYVLTRANHGPALDVAITFAVSALKDRSTRSRATEEWRGAGNGGIRLRRRSTQSATTVSAASSRLGVALPEYPDHGSAMAWCVRSLGCQILRAAGPSLA